MANPSTFPSKTIATERLKLSRRDTGMESPYNLDTQFVIGPSEWLLDWTWPVMKEPAALTINAWLASLNGRVESFRYYPRQPYDVSIFGGRTLATKAFNYGKAILVGGWAANAPSNLFAGQYVTVGDQLLMIGTASANADGSGRVTITLTSTLRSDYAAGTAVNLTAPFGIFRLASSEGHTYTKNPDRFCDFGTIAAREVVS